jgi:hypothetical protein
MNKYYTITLSAGTTSPGPYIIYLNQLNGVIPLLYPSLTNAENIDRDTLLAGVTIQTDGIPSSIVIFNEYCGTFITIPTPTTIIYNDFCLEFESKALPSDVYKHFIPNGLYGGFPSWVDDSNSNITITRTLNNDNWIINNYQPVGAGNTILSPNSVDSNPPLDWESFGGTNTVFITSSLGDCSYSIYERNFKRSVNQPTCLCDGSIIFNVDLDNPPFSYSIDNGVTYSSSPIFTNLCSGIYTLTVLDSLGNVYTSSQTIESSVPSTMYTISLSTSKTIPVNNNISVVNEYETTVVITPPLPEGATITFDLIHTNSFYSSPTSGTSILTTGTILYKNLSATTINSTITGNTTSINTTAGCQTDYIFQSNINNTWNSLTITNSDTITISTTSRVDKTITGKCVVGYSDDIYSISNAVISGCDCCSIKIN